LHFFANIDEIQQENTIRAKKKRARYTVQTNKCERRRYIYINEIGDQDRCTKRFKKLVEKKIYIKVFLLMVSIHNQVIVHDQ